MSYNLLKGKRGIIFGALADNDPRPEARCGRSRG